MSADRRRLLLSSGVLAVLVAVLWAMWPSTPAPSAAVPAPVARQAGPGSSGVPSPVAPVRLDSLTAGRHEPSDAERNPFRYQARVVAPPPRPVNTEPVAVTEAPRPVTPPGPPPAPPIALKFIGMMERANGVKWAVLSDGKNVMHGREGDIVEGRYRIVKIGTESVELTHVDGRGRQVVRLTGQ